MERPNRAAYWYGYTVCLVAVITLLISLNSLVNSAFRMSDPVRGGDRFGVSLTSFEAYRATLGQRPFPEAARDTSRPRSESDLRAQYEAMRSDHIAQNRFEAQRSIVTNGILIVVAVLLFIWHWRWLRALANGDANARG